MKNRDWLLINEEQIYGPLIFSNSTPDVKLKIIENCGVTAEITDYAILRGGEILEEYETKEGKALGSWWYDSEEDYISMSGNDDYQKGLVDSRNLHRYMKTDGMTSIRPAFKYTNVLIRDWKLQRNKQDVVEIVDGEYPQTIADLETSQNLEYNYELEQLTTLPDKEYDGNPVYIYNGEKYVRLQGTRESTGKLLSDKTEIEYGAPYWVKVENLSWYLDLKEKVALCKKVINSGVPFYKLSEYMDNELDKQIAFQFIMGNEQEKKQSIPNVFIIENLKRDLLNYYPLFAPFIFNCEFIETESVANVETNGINLFYNPTFMQNIEREERIFYFAHALCHLAFDHKTLGEGKKPNLWNIATDAVVNAFLSQDGIVLPPDAVNIKEALHMGTENMYTFLKQRGENLHNKSHDDHNMWSMTRLKATKPKMEMSAPIEKKNNFLSKFVKKNEKAEEMPKYKNGMGSSNKQEEKVLAYINGYAKVGEYNFFQNNKIERNKNMELLKQIILNGSHELENSSYMNSQQQTDYINNSYISNSNYGSPKR